MIPSQVVTGSANPNPLTFSYTKIDDEIYYAYSSGSNVQILKGASLKVIQILSGHKSDVVCVSWLTNDSKLLTASGNEIFLYVLNQNIGNNGYKQISEEFKWERVFTLKNSFEITAMSWLNPTSFIVGGTYLAKWKIDIEKILKVYRNTGGKSSTGGLDGYSSPIGISKIKEQRMIDKQARVTWTIDCSQPIHFLSCSPDGSLFATVTKYDRVIKVWYLQKKHVKKSKLDSDLEELERQQQQQLQQQQLSQQRQKGYYREQFNKLTNKNVFVPTSTWKPRSDEEINSPTQNNNNNDDDDDYGYFSPIQQELFEKKLKQKSQQKQKRFELESYGFIYLSHPRSITWISWRHRITSSHNILLTNCKDGIVRFWQQSSQSKRLQFNVSNIIQSAGTCDIIDWVSNFNEENLDTLINQDHQDTNSPSNNKDDNTNSSTKSTSKASILNNPILLRQKNSLARNKLIVDWIIGIKSDGSLFLWKLRTDTSLSKQTSSISIWINNKILSNQEVGPNRIISLYQPISLSDNTPSSINICFNSFNGAISCRKFFIQHHNHTQISNSSLTSRCYGHKGMIKEVNISRSSPYLSSIDQQNNVILWQANDTSVLPSPYFISDIGSFPNFYCSVWSPSKKYCFFSNKEGIVVYNIETNDSSQFGNQTVATSINSLVNSNGGTGSLKSLPIYVGFVKDSILPDNDWIENLHIIEPLSSLYTNSKQDSTLEYIPYEFFIIALNKDGNKIMVWGISIKRDTTYSPTGTTSMLHSRLLGTKEFERYSRITCLCSAPKGISDGINLYNGNSSSNPDEKVYLTQPIAITGNIEGYIGILGLTPRLKSLSNQSNNEDDEFDETFEHDKFDWELSEMVSYGAYQQPVESVKPAYFGRFASKAISTTNPNPEIHIWELESHTPSLKLEDTIRFFQSYEEEEKSKSLNQAVTISLSSQDTIQVNSSSNCCYSFSNLDDGNSSLAIGFGNQIKVLVKPVDRNIGSYKMPWFESHSFNDITVPCKSVEWGKDMSLYATSGNQILVFTKWMKPSEINDLSSPATKLFQRNLTEIQSLYHQESELSRSLPFYHPKFLSEYMMAGKFDTIELILNHIFKYLLNIYVENDYESNPPTHEIQIPSLSFDILHSRTTQSQSQQNKSSKSGNSDDVDMMNNYRGKDSDDEDEKDDLFAAEMNSTKFTKKQATKLNEILSILKLSNLTSSEQIQLLAVTDTYGEIGDMRGGLDENGSRFLLVTKIFQFLRRSLAPNDRPISLSTNDILWALHSEAQETILQVSFPSDPDWEALKQIGAGLWIKSPSTLRNVIEKLAKTTYTATKDAAECSLYYIALKKKGALIALHKAQKNQKQADFLAQDFTQPKWATAAAKSAFILQGKHKYEIAASLFLLSGQLKQAVNLIIQILGDFQLALVISRLYEGEQGEVGKMVIEDHIIPHAKKTNDRSLLSIGYWLLKKYEDAFTILLPSTVIENKKLDDFSYGAGYLMANQQSPSNISGSSSPSMYSGFSRNSSTASPKPIGYFNSQAQQITPQKAIFSQLRSSDIGPSLLYFFRFLKNHTLLRQISDDKKKDDQILRNSAYSYLNSGCTILALDNIIELEKLHPKLISESEKKRLRQEQEEKERKEQEEKERKDKEERDRKSNDLGLDFGGGSSTSSYFNSSSNYDMGLDFGGGGSSNTSSYFNSSSNYDMGLDFGNSNSSSSTSNYFNSSSNYDMGLDFGSTTTTKSTTNWDLLDNNNNNNNITTTTTITITDTNTNSNEIDKTSTSQSNDSKLTFYSLIDTELKSKSILLILIDKILVIRNQLTNNSNSLDELYSDLSTSITFYSKEYQLKESFLIDILTQFCLDRQYLRETVYLLNLNQKNPIERLESTCISIIKSISRMDDYQTSTDFNLLHQLILELYQSFKITKIQKPNQLVNLTIFLMILLLGWGNQRYDIILLLLDTKTLSFNTLMDKFEKIPFQYQDEQLVEDENQSDDESDDDLDKDKLRQIKSKLVSTLRKLFDYLALRKFRYLLDDYLKTNIQNPNQLYIIDMIHQRLNYWIGTIQLKLLIIPDRIHKHYQKKPPSKTAVDRLYDYIKSFKVFNYRDNMEVWNLLLYKIEHIDILDKIILGEDSVTSNSNTNIAHQEIAIRNTSHSNSGKVKFDEEVELFKDGDLLQSFCLDTTSQDLSVVAIATTRGIRELNLKHLYEYYRDDGYDITDTLSATDNFLSPSQSKKYRISTKSMTNLNISAGNIPQISTSQQGLPTGNNNSNNNINNSNITQNLSKSTSKQNVFKSAISSLSKHVDHNIVVQCLESHPTSSYYLSGGIDGSICLWQFGIPEVLTAYQLPSKPRIVKCHFNQSGTKFGACDMAGNILLWQFAAQEDTLRPFYSLQAHSKQTLDFTFLNSGSLLATAGISADSKKDVCLWDVLLPPHKSLIASFSSVQESGASSIIYSPKRQSIIVGGKKGSLSLYDIRMNKVVDTFQAHQLNTKTLAMDPSEEFMVSGSSDGNVKVWSLPSLTQITTFEDCHKKQIFVRPVGVFKSPVSTYGVMQVGIENNHIYSCGADSRLVKRRFYK